MNGLYVSKPQGLKRMFEMSSFPLISVTALGLWELRDFYRLVYISLKDDAIHDFLKQDSRTFLMGMREHHEFPCIKSEFLPLKC